MDHSDFAVLNDAGQVEDYGNWERLEDTVKSTQRPVEEEFSLENGGGGGGPTTLMLFNIFTPGKYSQLLNKSTAIELKETLYGRFSTMAT